MISERSQFRQMACFTRKPLLRVPYWKMRFVTLTVTVPRPLSWHNIPSDLIIFVRCNYDIYWYLSELTRLSWWNPDWPVTNSAPEQHHVWTLPAGTTIFFRSSLACRLRYFLGVGIPLPDRLHLCTQPCVFGCDESEEPCWHLSTERPTKFYVLQISRPMALESKRRRALSRVVPDGCRLECSSKPQPSSWR